MQNVDSTLPSSEMVVNCKWILRRNHHISILEYCSWEKLQELVIKIISLKITITCVAMHN
jgi:hypothetical protein